MDAAILLKPRTGLEHETFMLDFTEHGVDFRLTAPSDALSNKLTAAELAWLDAIKQLSQVMNEIFVNAPEFLSGRRRKFVGG
jgi:hypothetical protein